MTGTTETKAAWNAIVDAIGALINAVARNDIFAAATAAVQLDRARARYDAAVIAAHTAKEGKVQS